MFVTDERITASSFFLAEGPLSTVYLKNEACYPWFILVPRKQNLRELYELPETDQVLLIKEINYLSLVMQQLYNPEKLNVGALGNIVSQLHIHIVARYKSDSLWPQGIWQSSMIDTPYEQKVIEKLLTKLRTIINFCIIE